MTEPAALEPPPTPAVEKTTTDPPIQTSTNDSDCIICWEPIQSLLGLSCGHDGCRACIQSWIERCEQDGHDHATCPHCRQILDTEALLGRPYQSSNNHNKTPVNDSFTQLWFQDNNAHPCSNCGMWMVQDEDEGYGEEVAIACVCGYIYCWTCHCGVEDCECEHCEFYDQLTDMTLDMDVASRFPVAGPEDFQDSSLAAFMEERRQAIYDYSERDEDDSDDDDDEDEEEEGKEKEVEEEPAEADFVPLFGDIRKEVHENCTDS